MEKQLLELDLSKIPLFTLKGLKTKGRICDVYDGDTCKVVFRMNDEINRWNVRMTGYDTPEMRPPKSQANRELEIAAAKQAKSYLQSLIMNPEQLVYIKCGEFDKYGRLLGEIYIKKDDSKSVNQMMIEQGHGYAYDGGTKKNFIKKSVI